MCLETDVVRILTSCPNSMQVPEYFEKGFKDSAQVEPLRRLSWGNLQIRTWKSTQDVCLRMGIAFSYVLD